jgi:Tat protein secretion system quality control protein TatD with DNase activity
MDLVDSHCHLDPMRYGADLPDVLARARAAGVVGIVVVGTRAADSEAAAALAARESGIVAAAGIHPNDTADVEADEWDRVVAIVERGRAAAPGWQRSCDARRSHGTDRRGRHVRERPAGRHRFREHGLHLAGRGWRARRDR